MHWLNRRRWWTWGLVFGLLGAPAVGFAEPSLTSAPAPPLAAMVAELAAITPDTDTGTLTNNTHYFASNERDLDLVAATVAPLGDVWLAVGADPVYILAAWGQPSAVVVVDLDPAIVDLHAIYAVFFAHAETPEDFVALWSEAGVATAQALLAGDPTTADKLEIYTAAQPAVARRFADLTRRFAAKSQAWLLSDPAHYLRVAHLVRSGRVLAVRGDFTRAGVVAEIANLLQHHAVPLGLVYLSNIEQYFLYTQEFRANVGALPLATAQVVRTLPGRPAGFEYIVQAGDHFQRWVAAPQVRSVYRIRGFRRGEPLQSRTLHVIDTTQGPPTRTSK